LDLRRFRQYLVAGTVEEAVGLRKDVGPASLYIAGGTTVVPFASKSVDVLVDITGLGLDGWSDHGDVLGIGGTIRIADLHKGEIARHAPALARAARSVGSPLLRNMATIGGSLAGLSLPSDVGIMLLAVGAEVHLAGDAHRVVPTGDLLAEGWLSGYDLITEVRMRKAVRGRGCGFAKFGRSEVDIALVNAAAAVEVSERSITGIRLAIGQSGSRPVVLEGDNIGAGGREISRDLIREIAEGVQAAVKPRDDYRASADYRRHLIKVMAARALAEAIEEAGVDLAD
jgi:carbon-monoxide dehydrogenase medium subunit